MKKESTFWLLFLAVSILIEISVTPCVYASTYYISSSRGDDRAAGTSEQSAWCSLARLQQVTLQPGDLVLLRRGDSWNEALLLDKLRGSQEQPIRIADFATGPKPRLQPQQANLALSITHSHYVHVQNLHLMAPSGKKGVRIAGDSRFVKLSYCLVQGHPDATSGHGIVYSALSDGQLPTYPVVEHNEVSFFYEAIIGIGGVKQGGRVAYNYVHTATPTKGSDLIRAIGGDFEGLSIAHNHLTGWYDDAIDLYTGSNVVVEHNRIHTPGQPILGSGNAIKLGGVTNRVAKSPTSYNNVARYNLIYDLTTRPKGKLSNGIDTNGGYNATIYGNLIYNVKGNAINISAPGCKVFNNTAIGERKALYFNPANATLEAYNNILSGGKLDAHVEQASSRILGSNNLLVHSKTQGNYQSKNDRSGDPGFVNAKNHLFSLKPNSIAINAGVQIDEYQRDRLGNSITGRVTIGCYEYNDKSPRTWHE